ncbi:MAG: sulfotransferase [Thiobacillus sp.]|nr:sulfotransferase [Thiobacillus sp.]
MSASPGAYARIFLLSHMRAYTSLAGHILGSHPQINGYYEMHLGYEEAAALDRQLEAFRQDEVLKPGSRYLFDKLLHDDYALKPERLGLADIRILVALAEPAHTIRSIVHLFRQKPNPDLYASPVEAANYYVERMRALADYCRTTDWPYTYFDAELFVRAPERLLPRLTAWLELDSPLSERYEVFSHTGKARRGDTSERVRSGRIDRARSDYSEVVVPEEALSAAQSAYRECREKMIAGATDSVTL